VTTGENIQLQFVWVATWILAGMMFFHGLDHRRLRERERQRDQALVIQQDLINALSERLSLVELSAATTAEDAEVAHARIEYLRTQVTFAVRSLDSSRARLPEPGVDPARPAGALAPACSLESPSP